MAEAQFIPTNFNPVTTASTAATTMMSLFERAQKLRMAKERSQQAQELHELTIQSREQGLATGALNFEYEQLKLQAKQIEAQKQVEMEASNDRSYVNSVQGFFNLRSDINAEYARTENPNEQPSWKSVRNFENRLDRRRADANELMKSDPRRGRQILEELNSIDGLLNPMANQVKEANITRFGEMSTELVTLSSGTNTEPGSVRRELAKILTKYADLRHINPEMFKGLKDEALEHIQTLEKHAQEQKTAQAKALAASKLLQQRGLQEKVLQAEKPLTEEEKAAIREHEEKVHNNNVMIEEMKQSIQNLKDRKIRTGNLAQRFERKVGEYFFGERPEEKILHSFMTTRWVALVSQLKGALSDKEGAMFTKSLPNRKSRIPVWINFLEKQVANLEWYNARDPNAKPEHTEGGTAALQSLNALSGGQASAPAVSPTPSAQDETDYGPFGDNVNNLKN